MNTFALGDTYASSASPAEPWTTRADVLKAVYRSHFGMVPAVEVTGPGANHVIPDYRFCANGSILISLLNEHTNQARVVVNAPTLLQGRKVENLLTGTVLSTQSSGSVELVLTDDDFQLLYAYPTADGVDQSLVQTSPNKLWFVDTPVAVWPTGGPTSLEVGFHAPEPGLELVVCLDQERPVRRRLAASVPTAVQGSATAARTLTVPDADAGDPDYVSSRRGGEYVFRAELRKAGTVVASCSLPVRLAFGVRPATELPSALVPGQVHEVTLAWEELPSYLAGDSTPLDRARLWESAKATAQHYSIELELLSGGQVVNSQRHLTRHGTGSQTFPVRIPNAPGPFSWRAWLRTAPAVASQDVEDSFEGRPRGARWPDDLEVNFIGDWHAFKYTSPGATDIWQNEGVHLDASDGSQSAFLVITNLPNQDYSGFGLEYTFPAPFALPANPAQWSAYRFAFDFKEAHGLPCRLELQAKSDNGAWISFGQEYDPRTNAWNHVEATLDRFSVGPLPGFDPNRLVQIAVVVAMQQPLVQYVGSFDGLRFTGPQTDLGGGTEAAVYQSVNDSAGKLRLEPGPDGLQLDWTGSGILQLAPAVEGPWTDHGNARPPLLLQPADEKAFYRLRSP